MKGAVGVVIAIAVVVAIIVGLASTFIVTQTEQALVLRFGAAG